MFTATLRHRALHLGPRVMVQFHRTLRLPHDGKVYPLPPSLGLFPLKAVADYADRVPAAWRARGGFFLPLYQAEALWLQFSAAPWRANALLLGAGGVNVVTGARFEEGLVRDPQNYVVLPAQRWIDGFRTEAGVVSQFIAMPLGQGYTAEAQITGQERVGGLQFALYDPRPGRFPDADPAAHRRGTRGITADGGDEYLTLGSAGSAGMPADADGVVPLSAPSLKGVFGSARGRRVRPSIAAPQAATPAAAMGLGAGGRMEQEILQDVYDAETWERMPLAQVEVHLVNSEFYAEITGERPPESPGTRAQYERAGYPWFATYDEVGIAGPATPALAGLKTVNEIAAAQGHALPLESGSGADSGSRRPSAAAGGPAARSSACGTRAGWRLAQIRAEGLSATSRALTIRDGGPSPSRRARGACPAGGRGAFAPRIRQRSDRRRASS